MDVSQTEQASDTSTCLAETCLTALWYDTQSLAPRKGKAALKPAVLSPSSYNFRAPRAPISSVRGGLELQTCLFLLVS